MLMDLLRHLMCLPAAISSWGIGCHCHHRDSNKDLVSKGEEKLGIRKVRLSLSLNSHDGFKNDAIFEKMPQWRGALLYNYTHV